MSRKIPSLVLINYFSVEREVLYEIETYLFIFLIELNIPRGVVLAKSEVFHPRLYDV